jgi:hypothetical protein
MAEARSRAARRKAATNRSSKSMVSMSCMRGGRAVAPFRQKAVSDDPKSPKIPKVLTVKDRRTSDNQGLAS